MSWSYKFVCVVWIKSKQIFEYELFFLELSMNISYSFSFLQLLDHVMVDKKIYMIFNV